MKTFTLLLSMMPLLALLASSTNPSDPLATYRNQNRVILVFGAHANELLVREQLAQLSPESPDFQTRDLRLVQCFDESGVDGNGGTLDRETVALLREQYQVRRGEFCVILIGKDGGEKMRFAEPTPAIRFYDLIDLMPMRRREMRRR